MEKAKKQVKIFAIFYAFLGALNILAMILNSTWNYVFVAILAFVFALTLYSASEDITKYSLALIIAIVVFIVVAFEIISAFINGQGLFYTATNIIELILVIHVISLLNMFRKELSANSDIKTKVEQKEENKE